MAISRARSAAATVIVTVLAMGASLGLSGTAWSVTKHIPHPVLRFVASPAGAELILPNPPCQITDPGCTWTLVVNEPEVKGGPLIGTAEGTTGTLSVALPPFCGVVQADAFIGPAPVLMIKGIRETVNTCQVASLPAGLTSTQTPTATTGATGGTGTKDPTGAQLPFTGIDVNELFFLGMSLVLAGTFLITTAQSRRRALRRTASIRVDDVKEGARRTGSWFFGL